MPQAHPQLSLYIHIPFCLSKCPYCDFNTYQGMEHLIEPLVAAAEQEIRLWGEILGGPAVATIFFGGGTPSYIPIDDLAHILQASRESFQIEPGAEITLEANPGDLTPEKLGAMLEMRANRLSIGMQSLEDSLLSLLGRRHSAQEAIDSYRLALQAGFPNVNLDLMYGLPTQSMGQWQSTLDMILELRPHHLSLYCLTLEKGTPMEHRVSSGDLPQPDPDLAADMYLHAEEVLADAGYHHYEISNWCLPGHQCRHNMTYWLNQAYLGIGPGAHSSVHGYRFHDVTSPRQYIDLVRNWATRGTTPAQSLNEETLGSIDPIGGIERIDERTAMAETMFLGLRLLDGIGMNGFRERHGADLSAVYGREIQELTEQGLLEQGEGLLRLTGKGRLLANQVFLRFLE